MYFDFDVLEVVENARRTQTSQPRPSPTMHIPLSPAMSPLPLQDVQRRYKTELCRTYLETKQCKYGDRCQFAHGEEEIRIPNRHRKYKTMECKSYHTTGFCPYGSRCHFIHSESPTELLERRKLLAPLTPPASPDKPMFYETTSAATALALATCYGVVLPQPHWDIGAYLAAQSTNFTSFMQ